MSPFRFPLALVAFLGVVMVVPVWVWFVSNYGGALTVQGQFLAGLTLPGAILLYLGGWLG
jgi:hypothetical protein